MSCRLAALLICLVLWGSVGHGFDSAALAEEPASPRPSILVLLADDQRADTIRAWGNDRIRTPALDTLVEQGMSFRGNYCFGSNSAAVCVPSRAMFNSGRYWTRSPNDLKGVPILPEVLRENGYATFATGKWHNGRRSLLRGFAQGKAVFLGGMCDHLKVPIRDLEGGVLGEKRTGAKHSSELFADAAVEFLSTYRGEAPFFCYVAFTAPHDPRQPPDAFREAYAADRPPLPPNFLPQLPFDNGWVANLRDENLAPWPRTEAVVRDQLAEYYGLITHLDAQIGRVLAALRASPHAENTVVVYAADHGLAMGSHGLLGKQSVYEHSMRCPLILAGPGIPAGASTEAFTYLLDVLPTVCGLAGIPVPEGVDGRDLSGLWRGEVDAVRDSVFLPFTRHMRSVRDRRWKLIHYPQIHHVELFDLVRDPHETRNLADRPEHAERIETLTALLRLWQEETGDAQPLRAANPKPKAIDMTGRARKPDRHQPAWIVEKYFRDDG